jgi:hypothetical protein
LPAPPKNDGFNGPTKVSVTIGKSVASLKDITAGASPLDSQGGSPLTGTDSAPLDGATPGAVDAADGSGVVAAGALGSGVLPVDTSTLGPVAAQTSAGATNRAPTTVDLRPYDTVANTRDTSNVYLALLGVALTGSLAAAAVRLLGVRVPWTS